jgi:RNA polymerase sigma factor (sigma-70 family)
MVMPARLAPTLPDDTRARLADPALRRAIEATVKRRISGGDADDVVQATLADLLCAPRVPADAEEFRRFVFTVTRNKVVDHFRRRAREVPEAETSELTASEAPLSARDILRWAEGKLPDADAEHTLEWMLREGDGEKLEQIARDVNLPAPRVRQRVSRLRRFLRERWAAELMLGALGLVLVVSGAILYYEYGKDPSDVAKRELRPEPLPTPEQRGRALRRVALERCPEASAEECLDGLDRARALDPAGDAAPEVVSARSAAAARVAPMPSTAPDPSTAPPAQVQPIPSAAPDSSATPDTSVAPHASAAPNSTALPKPQKVPSVVTKPAPRFDSSDSPSTPPSRAPRNDSSL